MLTRITIDIPQPLAEAIAKLAAEHLRPPKQQILWLLREAVSVAPPPHVSQTLAQGAAHESQLR